MKKIRFWDVVAGGIVTFSGVNLVWGDKIHLFDFVADPIIKWAMMTVSIFVVSIVVNDFRKR